MISLSPPRRVSSILCYLQGIVDRVADEETRKRLYRNVTGFAREQPLLASFLLTHILLSILPLLLFSSFVLGTLLLALIAALSFSLFWIGVALLVLVPTLCVTLSLGVVVWVWAAGMWGVGRFVWGMVGGGEGGVKVEEEVVDGVVNGDAKKELRIGDGQ